MATSKPALGKGMSALLKSNSHMAAIRESKNAPIEPTGIMQIPLSKIEANKDQLKSF